MKITVSSKEFQAFISSILNINRNGVSLKVRSDCIEALVLTEDNSSVVLYARINILSGDGVEDTQIHIRDLTKFQRLLDMNTEETFTFYIKENYVYYESDNVKGAKFMLSENAFKSVNKAITPEWFMGFEKHFRMLINKQTVKKIIQTSSFASDTANKVYFYQDGEKVIAETNDRETKNLDTVSLYIGEPEDGRIEDKIIVNVSTLGKIYLADNMIMEASYFGQGVSKTEILFLTIRTDNVNVHYLINSMRT